MGVLFLFEIIICSNLLMLSFEDVIKRGYFELGKVLFDKVI